MNLTNLATNKCTHLNRRGWQCHVPCMDVDNDSRRGPFPVPADAWLRTDPKSGSKQPAFADVCEKGYGCRAQHLYFETRTCLEVKLKRMHFLGSNNTARSSWISVSYFSKFKENEAAILHRAYIAMIYVNHWFGPMINNVERSPGMILKVIMLYFPIRIW